MDDTTRANRGLCTFRVFIWLDFFWKLCNKGKRDLNEKAVLNCFKIWKRLHFMSVFFILLHGSIQYFYNTSNFPWGSSIWFCYHFGPLCGAYGLESLSVVSWKHQLILIIACFFQTCLISVYKESGYHHK